MPIDDYNGRNGFVLLDIAQPLSKTLNSNPADVSGIITITFDPVPYGYFWWVEIIGVSTTSTTRTTAAVYNDLPLVNSNIVSSTLSGNLDQDDRNSPILVEPTHVLSVQWTGASLGSVAAVKIQYRAQALFPGTD